MQHTHVTAFRSCVSQVSLVPSLCIPKRRELHQSQPTESALAAGPGLSTHPLNLTSLPRPFYQAAGTCSAPRGSLALPLLPFAARVWMPFMPFDHLPPPTSHPLSTTGRVQQTHYGSQTPARCPSLTLLSSSFSMGLGFGVSVTLPLLCPIAETIR